MICAPVVFEERAVDGAERVVGAARRHLLRRRAPERRNSARAVYVSAGYAAVCMGWR